MRPGIRAQRRPQADRQPDLRSPLILVAALALSAFPPRGLHATSPPRRVIIGPGSQYLRYPKAQATLKIRPGDTLYIAAGTYSGISLGTMWPA